MPQVKKNSVTKKVKKTEKKSEKKPKTGVKIVPKKIAIKKPAIKKIMPDNIVPEKKARPVMVDVIEDDAQEAASEKAENIYPELPAALSEEKPVVSEVEDVSPSAPLEIDQQKNFYSKLVSEIKVQKPDLNQATKTEADASTLNSEAAPKIRKSVSLYRRLAWRFVGLTAILLLIVFYFSFSKLTIIISPKGETINDNIALKIQPAGIASSTNENDFREAVVGTVKEETVEDVKTYSATGEQSVGDDITGKVTIINNSPKAQALVATTRILSPDNKLFRIKSAVNVPAGGEIAVDIYTEKPTQDMAISPTNFTIPGLWAGLQDKIYAKSTEAFSYSQKVNKYVKASDIEQADREMSDLLVAKVKEEQQSLGISDPGLETIYETLDDTTYETSAKAGDFKDEFTVKAKGKMLVISFTKDQVAKLAGAKLSLLVPDDKDLVDYDSQNITYSFDSYDAPTSIATVKASFGGTMVLKNNTEVIDKKQLVNLNRDQLEKYLKTFPEIDSYELKFFPSFITRAPRLPERIQIEIKGLAK